MATISSTAAMRGRNNEKCISFHFISRFIIFFSFSFANASREYEVQKMVRFVKLFIYNIQFEVFFK